MGQRNAIVGMSGAAALESSRHCRFIPPPICVTATTGTWKLGLIGEGVGDEDRNTTTPFPGLNVAASIRSRRAGSGGSGGSGSGGMEGEVCPSRGRFERGLGPE